MFPKRYLLTKRPPLKFVLLTLCVFCLLWTSHILYNQEPIEAPLLPVNPSWLVSTENLLPSETCVRQNSFSEFLPPTYFHYNQYERDLSIHNSKVNPDATYLFMANHAWGSGFGNVMQDYVIHFIFTRAAGRTPVFENYTWSADMEHEYSRFKEGRGLIPSRIPLNVVFSGPIAGSPLPSNQPSAITRGRYEEICQGRKVYFDLANLKERIDPQMQTDGVTMFDAWAKELRTIDEPCVEVNASQPVLFDVFLFGSPRLHSLSKYYFNSEILKYFSFSPLIHDAFNRNMRFFLPRRYMVNNPPSNIVSLLSNPFDPHNGCPLDHESQRTFIPPHSPKPWNETPPLPGLLVLHIRQGDFEEHCLHLANWGSDFQALNSLLTEKYKQDTGKRHPDQFISPGSGWGENTPENHEIYRRRCRPAVADIVQKFHQINERRRSQQKTKLSSIYVMTNANSTWLTEVKKALTDDTSDGALQVYTSRDLDLTHDQKYVSHVLDMYVGARAEVFVGNGFSSLTSNIVMLRMARGLDALDTGFW